MTAVDLPLSQGEADVLWDLGWSDPDFADPSHTRQTRTACTCGDRTVRLTRRGALIWEERPHRVLRNDRWRRPDGPVRRQRDLRAESCRSCHSTQVYVAGSNQEVWSDGEWVQ